MIDRLLFVCWSFFCAVLAASIARAQIAPVLNLDSLAELQLKFDPIVTTPGVDFSGKSYGCPHITAGTVQRVIEVTLWLDAWDPHIFTTGSTLGDTADPVLCVVNNETGDGACNDDLCVGDVCTRDSTLNPFVATRTGAHTAFVFSKDKYTGGETRLWGGETRLWAEFGFFTNHLTFGPGLQTTYRCPLHEGDRIESVFMPGALTDTKLLVTEPRPTTRGASWATIGYADAGQVGRQAAWDVPFALPAVHVLVAPTLWSHVGPARLLINDLSVGDCDSDTLSDNVEAWLGSCPGVCEGLTVDDSTCAARWPQDSDADGLDDGWEVRGCDHDCCVDDPAACAVSRPQYLPKWGANPLHKDLFVENDWTQARRDDLADGEEVVVADADFAEFPGCQQSPRGYANYDPPPPDEGDVPRSLNCEEVEIPVAIYGAPDTAASVDNQDGEDGIALHVDIGRDCGDANTHAGDWNGANVVPYGAGRHRNHQNCLSPQRQRVFRYALGVPKGGQTDIGGRALAFHWNAPHTFAHELGHSSGLDHYGSAASGAMNCKPQYRSIMNYAYGGETRLSLGEFVFDFAGLPLSLNPEALCEGYGLGILDNSRDDIALEERQAAYDQTAFLTDSIFEYYIDPETAGVDWNRDGQIEPDSFDRDCLAIVRAPITWGWHQCGAPSYHAGDDLAFLDVTPDTTVARPVLGRLGARLYAFYPTASGFQYRWTDSTFDEAAGCTADNLASTCHRWSTARSMPHGADAHSVVVHEWAIWGVSELVVAYGSDGNLFSQVLTVSPVGSESWSERALLDGSGEVAPAQGDMEEFEGRLYVVYRTTSGLRMLSLDSWGPSEPRPVIFASGRPIVLVDDAKAGVSLTVGPEPAQEFVDGRVQFRAWQSLMMAYVRPADGMVQVAAMRLNGRFFDDGPYWVAIPWAGENQPAQGTPALTWSAEETGGRYHLAYRASTNELFYSESYKSDWGWRHRRFFSGTYTDSPVGLDYYVDVRDGRPDATRLAWIDQGDGVWNVRFFPFADGIVAAQLQDVDDFAIIADRLCSVLRGSRYCR